MVGQIGSRGNIKLANSFKWKKWWRLSNSPALNIGMNKMWFAQQGYYSLNENYKTLHRKSL